MTVTAAPVLHVPDEPTAQADGWLAAVLDGGDLDDVLSEPTTASSPGCGPLALARRRSGSASDDFGRIVLGYRRELWLWLAGERTWAQCCSGLIGRINRRIAGGDDAGR